MTDRATLKFSPEEDALFCELVVEIINTLKSPRFSIGDYVGGQADMSSDQETHILLEYAEVIDVNLSYRLSSEDLRVHLINTSRFGVGLDWLLECFLSVVAQHSALGWDHILFSYDPFEAPENMTKLVNVLTKAGYLKESDDRFQWIGKARAILGLMCWGHTTSRGIEAREEARRIIANLPKQWSQLLAKPRGDWNNSDWRDFENALSNHWYNEQWNDTPVRGQRSPVRMRHEMNERVNLILTLYGEIELETIKPE